MAFWSIHSRVGDRQMSTVDDPELGPECIATLLAAAMTDLGAFLLTTIKVGAAVYHAHACYGGSTVDRDLPVISDEQLPPGNLVASNPRQRSWDSFDLIAWAISVNSRLGVFSSPRH